MAHNDIDSHEATTPTSRRTVWDVTHFAVDGGWGTTARFCLILLVIGIILALAGTGTDFLPW